MTYCAGWRRALTRSAKNWSSPLGLAGLPFWSTVAVRAYRATPLVKYKSRRITRATITRPVMGALKTPIMRIERSTIQSQNSRRRRLQHPLFVGACSLLSKPLLVQTITASLVSLTSLVLETSAEVGDRLASGRRSLLGHLLLR